MGNIEYGPEILKYIVAKYRKKLSKEYNNKHKTTSI